ncbi:MAG: GNAT family N-acetyltransferase [Acidimicrobiia bacterium]
MASLQIRRYEPRDFQRVLELHVLGLRQTGTDLGPGSWDADVASHEALAANYLDVRGDFVVGELEGVIVAMGALRPFDDTRVEMKRVRVHPDHQRLGFGDAIVERLEQAARELGYDAVHLDTTTQQEPAIAMYLKRGYHEVGRAALRRFDLVLMEKPLVPGPPPAILAQRVATAFALGGVHGIEPVVGGLLNRMWKLDTDTGSFAVKQLVDRPWVADWSARQARCFDFELAAHAAGIPMPPPVANPATGDAMAWLAAIGEPPLPVVVHEWLRGEPLPLAAVSANVAHQVGAALARIHGLGIEVMSAERAALTSAPMPTRDEWSELARRGEASGESWAADLADAVDALAAIGIRVEELSEVPGRVVIGHRDANQKNLVMVDGTVHLVDWENAGATTVEWELGSTAIDLTGGSPSAVRAFFDGYRSVDPEPLPPVGDHWLVPWLSSYMHFAAFNARRCLGDYGDKPTNLDIPRRVMQDALADLPYRLHRVPELVGALRAAVS